MKLYLFRRKNSKVVHGVRPNHSSLGHFEQDRIFGNGFYILCGQKAEGAGVMSETPKPLSHVSCKSCRKKESIKAKIKPWNPKPLRKLDNPRSPIGVPG